MPLSVTGRSSPNVEPAKAGGIASGNRSPTLWTIVIAAAVLRLIALGRKSFWLDEIASVAIARRPWPVLLHFLWHDEGNMAAYYLLLKPWLHFGYGEAAVRLLSVIAGILSVPLMYRLGTRLFGRQVGILSAALLAVSTCAISVSQEARAYSFVVLLVVLSTSLFVQLIESPGYGLALAYGAAAGLTCYFHYFGVLVPAAHAVSVLALSAKQRPWKPLALAWTIIAALAAPILWLMHAQDIGHLTWLQSPSWLELYHLGVFLAADGGKAVGAVLLALELVLAGFFVARFKTAWRDDSQRDKIDHLLRWRYALVASAVATPIVITLLASIVRPAFYHRFLIICLPGWLLMIALGAMQIRPRAICITAIAAVCTLSLITTVLLYTRETEDWRAAVHYLMAHASPQDRVLYYQPVGEFAGESYREWLTPASAPYPLAVGVNPTHSDWKSSLAGAPRVWLVLYRTKPDDAEARAIEQDLNTRFAAATEQKYAGITVIEYQPR